MDYVSVVPVLVEAIKEQQRQINALKAQQAAGQNVPTYSAILLMGLAGGGFLFRGLRRRQ